MRVKLSHKLFAAFLCTSVLTVVSMVVIMQIYAARNFTDYINRVEIEKLSDLLDEFKEQYIEHQGWDHLRGNPRLWRDIVHPRNYRRDPDRLVPPPPPPGEEEFEEAEPGSEMPGADGVHEEGPAYRPLPPARPLRRLPGPFSIAPRVSLFDDAHRLVAGNAGIRQEQVLKAIVVDGETVGWLGLQKRTQPSHPLDVEFAKQQARVFFLTGMVTLCLAALVAVFLSGHLVRPIRKLIEGTQALSRREFETRVTIASHDELGQLASNFNHMAQALYRYEGMRRQWLSDISHELRTPLSILRAEIEAMQDGFRKTDGESLQSLHDEILYLIRIVNDLHELSLAESAMLTTKKEPVRLIGLLRSSLKSFETRFRDCDIRVEDNLELEREFVLVGDESRLKQLFSNILENTLRYADSPGTLKIWHQFTTTGLTLNFLDSGPGVPEESLARLFDRLYRGDAARTREGGGSGLGLAICKSIVEALGGHIRAANAPAAGLWITIFFPCSSSKLQEATQGP
jgi:two-component system, OmpR family, sensor histidine kinase BaeS